MTGFFARLSTLRLWMLFYSLPYALLWVSSSGSGEVIGSGGLLTVAIHSLLMLLLFAGADLRQIGQGMAPRLRVTRSFDLPDEDNLGAARAHLACTTLALIVIQLIVEPRMAVFAFLALLAVLIGTSIGGESSRVWRQRFAEGIWPVGLLMIPMMLIASPGGAQLEVARELGDEDAILRAMGGVMSNGAVASTCLGALMLSSFVVMCFVRDRVQDVSDGARTIATALGRDGAVGALFVLLMASIVLANWAAGHGLWSWHVPAVLAIGSMICVRPLSMRDDAGATSFLFMTHVATGILLVASVGSG